jgi:hypothetical protein
MMVISTVASGPRYAIRNMTLGVPVADAALYLVEKVEAAHIRQVSEVANEVCDRMLVARAAMLLKSRHGFRNPGNVARLVDHGRVALIMTISKRRDCSPQRQCRLQLPIEEQRTFFEARGLLSAEKRQCLPAEMR